MWDDLVLCDYLKLYQLCMPKIDAVEVLQTGMPVMIYDIINQTPLLAAYDESDFYCNM